MMVRFVRLAIVLFALGALAPCAAEEAGAPAAAPEAAERIVVAVPDFGAKDVDIADAVTETFTNDMARSKKLLLVERTQLKRVLDEHKIPMGGLSDPAKAAEFGKFLQARHLVLGRMTVIGDRVALHGRLVDVEKGTIVEGAALTREGDKNDLYGLAHQLATCLHHAITGEFLPGIEAAPEPAPAGTAPNGPTHPPALAPADPFASLAPSTGDLQLEVRFDRPRGAVYYQGEKLKVSFKVDRPCYVYLFNVDTSRYVSQILPNDFRGEERLQPGVWYHVPGEDEGWEFSVEGKLGEEEILAVASVRPLGRAAIETALKQGAGYTQFAGKQIVPRLANLGGGATPNAYAVQHVPLLTAPKPRGR